MEYKTLTKPLILCKLFTWKLSYTLLVRPPSFEKFDYVGTLDYIVPMFADLVSQPWSHCWDP